MTWTEQILPMLSLSFVIGAMATLVVLLASDLEREAGNNRVRLVKDWFDYAVGFFVIGGVVIAVIAAWLAYSELSDVRENARVAQTLGYVNRLKSGPMFVELHDLANLVTPAVLLKLQQLADPAAQTQYLKALYDRNNSNGTIRDVADFYDELFVCSVAQICNPALAERLIGKDDIISFYALAEPVLDSPGFASSGCGLRAFRDMAANAASQLDGRACPMLIH